MTLGIMQPYFFPYLGYYELIAAAERWVVFDVTQYTHKSWMSRNRILHPSKGWQYISLSLKKASQANSICEIMVDDPIACRDKMLRQLEHYKKSAPFYTQTCEVVASAFERAEDDSLVGVNIGSLASVCEYLGIAFHPAICSRMNLPLPPITHPGQWALEISTLLGADHYINPPGGKDIFTPDDFAARGIRLTFLELPDFTYSCRNYTFEPHLSIVDVLMWNAPETVSQYIHQHLQRQQLA